MTDKTLTPAEWDLILNLPADGETYNVAGVAFRAKHLPSTKIKVEQVICECRCGVLRRRLVNGKWQATEHIASY